MPGSTSRMNLPYPLGNETADVAGDIKKLAEAVDANAAPNIHKTQHATGGADALTPADIGAANQADLAAHLADKVQHIPYAVATGSANAYAVTISGITAYQEGFAVAVKINVDNTGPSTLNVNGLGAAAIKKPNGNDVSAGNLKAGSVYTVRYNGTNFILQGSDAAGNATPGDVLSGKTFTNDQGEQTGTMPNRGQQIITPGISNIVIPAGYHDGTGYVVGDADLISGNIRSGKNIFGVNGSLIPKIDNAFPYVGFWGTPQGVTWQLGFRDSPSDSRTRYSLSETLDTSSLYFRTMSVSATYDYDYSGDEVAVVTSSAIDLSSVNYILILADCRQRGNTYFIASTNKMGNHTVYNARINLNRFDQFSWYSLDVSTLSGNFYLRFHVISLGSTTYNGWTKSNLNAVFLV